MELLTILLIFFCYLIGSIPMGLIISKIFFNKDLRVLGSKNIGSTNTFRVLGPKYGIIVFLLDFFKGFWVFFLKSYLDDPNNLIYFGVALILGHMFSIFNNFKGGKAIATSVGFITVIDPLIGISGVLMFMIFVMISGYASLSSLLATFLVNVFLWVKRDYSNFDKEFDKQRNLIFILIITIIIFIKHSSNIINLIKGKENRIRFKKNNKL
ncbi:glycerol-3-phosphate 1-O-acyltransferase PlsY ['Camptotheca acuminata' phytoplasma]|uniref:glycerol-3-phosphate 1-O-acyltransferase PlsY n=1 Tax='Camptotheca acuminata' phytoplasma TaxID=3239192 RepID=UPI00351AA2D7